MMGKAKAKILIMVGSLFLIHCGSQEKSRGSAGSSQGKDGESSGSQDNDARGSKKPPRSRDRQESKPPKGGDTGAKLPGSSGKPGGGPEFFAASVKPVFQTMCVNCHADPRQPVEVRAPLSIYSYESMRAFLDQGGGPQDNKLWNLVRNIDSHTGGDRCSNGADASPCKEIAAWWTAAFGASKGDGEATLGRITEVTSLGRVYGWAFNPKDANGVLEVTLYVDGPKVTGKEVGTVTANKPGNDGNAPGDHAFTLDLPDAYRNGKEREIYGYTTINGQEKPLSTLPTKYTAYAFSQAGRDFYAANVQGRLGGCGGCHTISYEQQFYSLITPSPVKGGTVTNNQLINKAAQTNGTSHGGGQSCGNANASPCAEFQRWWQVEFGGN